MKFISKSANLLIVLRPGLQAQPLTGTPAVPTISVRFKDGVADVQQEELIKMVLAHPGFNGDFISAESKTTDPYASSRQSSEPAHIITEMKYGTPVSRVIKGAPVQLPAEMQKLVKDAATQLAKEMLPSMIESALKSLVASHEEAKDTGKVKTIQTASPKKKPGRPPKAKKEEKVEEIEIQDIPEPVSSPE